MQSISVLGSWGIPIFKENFKRNTLDRLENHGETVSSWKWYKSVLFN